MNRLTIGLILICSAASGAQVSLSSVRGAVGATVAVDVQFAAQGAPITGLQFDIEADSILSITATLNSSVVNAGKSLSTSDLGSGKKRFLVAGLNQNTVPDGVLLSLRIAVPSDSGSRVYSLHVANSGATDKDGKTISLTSNDGALIIGTVSPVIDSVINGASFLPGAIDGSWISIKGANLATTTRTWGAADIVNGRLPTSLDEVRVTVGGLPAAVYYVSPTQLNVQSPATGQLGPLPVVVTNSLGTSPALTVDVRRNSPGVFVFSPAGGKYAAAVIARPDGTVDYLGPSGIFGTALATRPVRPGEVLELYATGLGPTNPAVTPGQVVSAPAPLVDSRSVSIGGLNAPIAFAGLVGPGLYQLNVTVPALASGDQLLLINVNGVSSQLGVFIAVGQ